MHLLTAVLVATCIAGVYLTPVALGLIHQLLGGVGSMVSTPKFNSQDPDPQTETGFGRSDDPYAISEMYLHFDIVDSDDATKITTPFHIA